jgi:hypothetical protein
MFRVLLLLAVGPTFVAASCKYCTNGTNFITVSTTSLETYVITEHNNRADHEAFVAKTENVKYAGTLGWKFGEAADGLEFASINQIFVKPDSWPDYNLVADGIADSDTFSKMKRIGLTAVYGVEISDTEGIIISWYPSSTESDAVAASGLIPQAFAPLGPYFTAYPIRESGEAFLTRPYECLYCPDDAVPMFLTVATKYDGTYAITEHNNKADHDAFVSATTNVTYSGVVAWQYGEATAALEFLAINQIFLKPHKWDKFNIAGDGVAKSEVFQNMTALGMTALSTVKLSPTEGIILAWYPAKTNSDEVAASGLIPQAFAPMGPFFSAAPIRESGEATLERLFECQHCPTTPSFITVTVEEVTQGGKTFVNDYVVTQHAEETAHNAFVAAATAEDKVDVKYAGTLGWQYGKATNGLEFASINQLFVKPDSWPDYNLIADGIAQGDAFDSMKRIGLTAIYGVEISDTEGIVISWYPSSTESDAVAASGLIPQAFAPLGPYFTGAPIRESGVATLQTDTVFGSGVDSGSAYTVSGSATLGGVTAAVAAQDEFKNAFKSALATVYAVSPSSITIGTITENKRRRLATIAIAYAISVSTEAMANGVAAKAVSSALLVTATKAVYAGDSAALAEMSVTALATPTVMEVPIQTKKEGLTKKEGVEIILIVLICIVLLSIITLMAMYCKRITSSKATAKSTPTTPAAAI